MRDEQIGTQLRALRTASGRTVASVAADAGLSVPYIANLENGRGNPTVKALRSLAVALGTDLRIELGKPDAAPTAPVPPELARLGRTRRFRATVATAAEGLGQDPQEFSARLLGAASLLAPVLGQDLSEPDWWRLLDAILLISAHRST
ncbi:helix-turn-helix domain-containing protein [Allokutzneria albata]|uniref:Transcriptional regulator, contains XRE-family HTH domain n=1 Tax=Allokutzneria albata TaxID=211114 RepID=A0A1G9USN8_ALLAB|nr:helix-turn-helix transcriptional regulator [Allokutzneria albata]SDM62923.1 Transcriptional regulator, contains XRE-family HTH domain [Allokutzneria albata]